ncbi:hypothetical protein Q9L58_004630 [Maublancomyces gigas]|uniref:H-type lectin domain-containing protein n=1 Tax=Discina gigas TaxID=1032678 RepID=A0ABR3GKC5_9PEZI
MSSISPVHESDTARDIYEPPSFLVSSTQLSLEDLVRQYNIFKNAMRYVSAAPELVFERLISSMGEAYTARHHVGRIQDAETEAPLVETIRPTLEQISAAIEALREQISTQHAHGTTTVNDTVAQLQALLAQLHLDMSVSAPRDLGASDSLRASLISAQSEDVGRITMAFAQAGENTGVRMTISAEASYPTSAPWPDILDDYPPAQWGSQTIRRTNSSPFEPFTRVRFPTVFNKTPSVTCWLTGFESTEPPLRARVRTSQVSSTGFIIHIQPPTLLSVGISWLAGLPPNQIGEFDA